MSKPNETRWRLFKNLSSARELRSRFSEGGLLRSFRVVVLCFFPSFFLGCHIPIHIHADKLDDVQRSLFSPSLLT